MSSRAQKRANKQNAKLSTGPRTDEGKQRCSQNALKHGLRSKHPVIPGEDPLEYQRKLERLRTDLRPVNSLEDDLVEQIADASWRLKRLTRVEAAVGRYEIEQSANKSHNAGKDDEQILGNAFIGYSLDNLTRLSRYEGQLSRRYHRLVKELRDLRKTRNENFFAEQPYNERQQQQPRERSKTNPTAQPTIDLAAEVKRNEQTQSIETLLKSVASGEPATPKPSANIDFHRINPTRSGHNGPKEVTK